jgi:hypothetical protein
VRARDELVSYFQAGITEARQQQAQGLELKGVLGRMVSAQDEQGSRCGFEVFVCGLIACLGTGAVRCVPPMMLFWPQWLATLAFGIAGGGGYRGCSPYQAHPKVIPNSEPLRWASSRINNIADYATVLLLLLLLLLVVARLTDAEITSNILLVLLAGHDTSSTTLTRCLSNLHDHPWVLDKLRAEQAAVRASRGEALTPYALKEMPFADAVLRYVSVSVFVCLFGMVCVRGSTAVSNHHFA